MIENIIVALSIVAALTYVVLKMTRPFRTKKDEPVCGPDKCANCSMKLKDGFECEPDKK